MEHRGTIFVEAMVVFAIIGVLAFLIGLLVRAPKRQQAGAGTVVQPESSPRWYEFTLALILLAVVAAFAIWLISGGTHWVWGETIADWRSDTHTMIFAVVMVALAVIGLAVSLAYALVQSAEVTVARRPEAAPAASAPAASTASASPLRVLGVLALAIAVQLLCWIALPAATQHGLFLNLIYPAGLGVTMVLLLDKATRTWGAKAAAESWREWLLCDLLALLLVVAFLNLRSVAKPDTYTASVWDMLNVVLFFAAFWTIDRTSGRGRFLIAYGYLVLLPVLLLIWQITQGVAGTASWWGSPWPFLILAGVFFVLEAVTVVASAGGRQTLPAVKDTIFVVAFAVLLIIATRLA
jgi:hypothetical protein